MRVNAQKTAGTGSKMMKQLEDEEPTIWEKLVIMPGNPYKGTLDLFMAFATLMDIFAFSYKYFYLYFKNSFFLTTTDIGNVIIIITTVMLSIDILFRFIQGYYVGSKMILVPRTIAINYLKYFLCLHFFLELIL